MWRVGGELGGAGIVEALALGRQVETIDAKAIGTTGIDAQPKLDHTTERDFFGVALAESDGDAQRIEPADEEERVARAHRLAVKRVGVGREHAPFTRRGKP